MKHDISTHLRAAVLGLGLPLLAACGDGTGSDTVSLTVALTDAPHPALAAADITFASMELIRAGGAPVPLELTGSGGPYNLLELQDGVIQELSAVTIPADRYLQLRIVVEAASVTLAPGYTFQGEDQETTRDLFVPSGATSGIKINLSAAGREEDGGQAGVELSENSILVVDMDVYQNFVVQQAGTDPTLVRDVLFTPLLRATFEDVAASISGTVQNGEGVGLADITVRAVPTEAMALEDGQTGETSAMTGDDGTYTLLHLAPGTYEVSIDGAQPQTITVGPGEHREDVDFTVE